MCRLFYMCKFLLFNLIKYPSYDHHVVVSSVDIPPSPSVIVCWVPKAVTRGGHMVNAGRDQGPEKEALVIGVRVTLRRSVT